MKVVFIFITLFLGFQLSIAQAPRMMFGDTSRIGVPFSKDPHVVRFEGRYLMYYSIPPEKDNELSGWNIGIAESRDLVEWKKVGEITPAPDAEYEKKGLCAPGALVRDGKVHLFYQTYGNGPKDAICHAVSDDGIRFERNPTNPIFRPTGDWNCGRAIDAEVCEFKGRYFLYFATRDPEFKKQLLGVLLLRNIRILIGKIGNKLSMHPFFLPSCLGKENALRVLPLPFKTIKCICFMPVLTITGRNR